MNGDVISGQPGLGIVLKAQGRKQDDEIEVDRWAHRVLRHLRNYGLNLSGHRAKACFVSLKNSMPHTPKQEVAA